MERGNATSPFQAANSLDNDVLTAHSITSEAEGKMSQACDLLHQEMATLHSRPKPGSFLFLEPSKLEA